ncbi:Cyclin A [Carabus blaptoides fortunei]
MNRQVPNYLDLLNAAIREIEGTVTTENARAKNNSLQLNTVKKTEDIETNQNPVRVGAAIPDAITILDAVITKSKQYQSSRIYDVTSYDHFYGTQSEYHEDILNYMVELEIEICQPKLDNMDKQPEVTGAMRRELVDWLVLIFQGTNDKVLHMTVNYIDTFLSRMSIVQSNLHLLACAAAMVASGEIFTENQLHRMERIILSVMKFELCRPTILCFIRHLCFIGGVNAKDSLLAYYMSELVLIEEKPVDLTWNFDNNTIYWVGVQPFTFTKVLAEFTKGNFWLAMNEFCAGEHGGTHIDAPYHFNKEGLKVGDIPLERLIAHGVVIDISKEVEITGPSAKLEASHLIKWVEQNGEFESNTVILVKFGWSQYFHNKTEFLGTIQESSNSLHFPGLSEEAAQWIADTKKVVGVGVDTASIDPGSVTAGLAHRVLNGQNIYLLENVKLLEDLPARDFTLLVMPMKIREGTGAPLRLVATPKFFSP